MKGTPLSIAETPTQASTHTRPKFTSEQAREAQRKSVAARLAAKDPDGKARKALLKGAADAADVLISVANASKGFEDVKPELRLKAALVVLEYVLGKPKGFDNEEEDAPEVPENIFEALLGGGN